MRMYFSLSNIGSVFLANLKNIPVPGRIGLREYGPALLLISGGFAAAGRIMSDDQLAGTGLKSAAGCLESSGMMPCGSLLSHFLKICRLVIE